MKMRTNPTPFLLFILICAGLCQVTPAMTRAAGASWSFAQAEITASPQTVIVDSSQGVQTTLGLVALNRLSAPVINGQRLVNSMLTGSILSLSPSGQLTYTYRDNYSRSYRGRGQYLPQGALVEDLLTLPQGWQGPKILNDAYRIDTSTLVMASTLDAVGFIGEITYEFDFGLPLTAISLAGGDGSLKTSVGDAGEGFEILGSTDGVNWRSLWSSVNGEIEQEVDFTLPNEFVGAQKLYIKFKSNRGILWSFYLSATLDGSGLVPLAQLVQGQNQFQFSDAASSSHEATLLFKVEGTTLSALPTSSLSYPTDTAQVVETDDAITISFPQQVAISLARSSANGISGIKAIYLGENCIARATGSQGAAPVVEVVSDGEIGGITDWGSYLIQRRDNGMRWPSTGGRSITKLSLANASYLGTQVQGSSVVLTLGLSNNDQSGTLTWRLTPLAVTYGTATIRGLVWDIKISGMDQAAWFSIREPLVPRYGNWVFQQTWGRWYEQQTDFLSLFSIPLKGYFSDSQPYYFSSGAGGTAVAGFNRAVAAQVTITEEDGRRYLDLRIPMDKGVDRSTPSRVWILNDTPISSKWEAVDYWTSIYDALATAYRTQESMATTDPRPLMLWANMDLRPDPGQGQPALEQSLFYQSAQEQIPKAKQYGFASLLLDGPWDSDWDHATSEYLPGSGSGASGNAPWHISPSPLQGGQPGLDYLAQEASRQGLNLILWNTPGHLSNSSPLFLSNPDWVRWKLDGEPEDADYDDITGTDMDSGWFQYSVDQIARIHQSAPFTGFLVDSWLTFGTYPDGSDPQPVPALARSIEMQREWRQLGISEIYIEGTGPFGVSSGGYGAEGLGGADEPLVRQAYDRIKGKEYGLYRYSADTIVEADSYYRTLASKGVVPVYSEHIGTLWSDDVMAAVTQANKDYLAVLDRMQHRRLITQSDQWIGVAWTKDGSSDQVLFAFSAFDYAVTGCAIVEDVTAGTRTQVQGTLSTQPFHTYIIYGASSSNLAPSGGNASCPSCSIQPVAMEGNYTSIPYMGDLWPSTWADDGNLYLAFGDATGMNGCLPTLLLDAPDEYDTAYTEVSPGCYTVNSTNNEYCEVFSCAGCLPLCQYTPAGLIRLSGGVPNFDTCPGQDQCVVSRHVPFGDMTAFVNSDKPSSLIFIKGRMYIHMHYPAGDPTHGYLAYSDDYGVHWNIIQGTPWGPQSPFQVMMFINMGQAYDLNSDGYLYGLGVMGEILSPPTDLDVYLARVPVPSATRLPADQDPILNYSNYQYYAGVDQSGNPLWCSDQTKALPLDNLKTQSQCSAMFHQGIGSYILFCGLVGTAPGEQAGMPGVTQSIPVGAIFEAKKPWGPWQRSALVPGGFIGALIPKDAGAGSVYYTAAGGGGVTYNLNVGKFLFSTP